MSSNNRHVRKAVIEGEGLEGKVTTAGGVPVTSDLGAANNVISHTVTTSTSLEGAFESTNKGDVNGVPAPVDGANNNSNQGPAVTPETLETRIKNTIFRILKLPLEGIQYAKAHVEVIAGKVELVIKTDIEDAKIDVEHFLHHDRFSRDAINEYEKKKEFHFTPPESSRLELEKLANLTTNLPADGVIAREDSINKILNNLNNTTG